MPNSGSGEATTAASTAASGPLWLPTCTGAQVLCLNLCTLCFQVEKLQDVQDCRASGGARSGCGLYTCKCNVSTSRCCSLALPCFQRTRVLHSVQLESLKAVSVCCVSGLAQRKADGTLGFGVGTYPAKVDFLCVLCEPIAVCLQQTRYACMLACKKRGGFCTSTGGRLWHVLARNQVPGGTANSQPAACGALFIGQGPGMHAREPVLQHGLHPPIRLL